MTKLRHQLITWLPSVTALGIGANLPRCDLSWQSALLVLALIAFIVRNALMADLIRRLIK